MMTESITNEIRNIQADIMCEDTDNTRNGEGADDFLDQISKDWSPHV